MSDPTHAGGTDPAPEGAAATPDPAPASIRGVWSAPGRVNLIGEHTDYNDGFVLPFAIDRRTSVEAQLDAHPARPDDAGTVTLTTEVAGAEPVRVAAADIRPDLLQGWAAYPLGVFWALAEQQGTDARRLLGAAHLSLHFRSDVPLGAGLSSSAAIESATALALCEIFGLDADRRMLARVGQRAENEAVGAPTGIMDQSASLLAEAEHAVFLDCRSLEAELVPFALEAEGLVLLVADSRVEHAHATGGYAARRASCERAAAAAGVPALRDLGVDDLPRLAELVDDETLRRARHIVTENARVLETVAALRASGPRAIGDLLDASHASMRDDFEISCIELDAIVEAAREAGAIGARMTGGGFGGSAIALVESANAARVAEAIRARAARDGHPEPSVFAVRAAEGARRDA